MCNAWVGNVARADEGLIRLTMFGATATMFVLALSIPEAFDDGWPTTSATSSAGPGEC